MSILLLPENYEGVAAEWQATAMSGEKSLFLYIVIGLLDKIKAVYAIFGGVLGRKHIFYGCKERN